MVMKGLMWWNIYHWIISMKIFVTHPLWLGWVCQTELHRLGYSVHRQGYGLVVDDRSRKDVYTINLWSRIANKVFVVLWSWKITDFDGLFDLVGAVDWKQYIPSGSGVRVLAQSHDSQLSSTRTIQSIAHKSILMKLTGSRDIHRESHENKSTIEISIDIYKDMVTVLLNTSGVSLHERGYRTEQWEAPLKENIAAWLLMLSWWDNKKPLYDPFCGSGTICIEWVMMAMSIAPWLHRSFVFQDFPCFDGFVWHEVHHAAVQKKHNWSLPNIVWSDIDTDVLVKAQANADRAGVGKHIHFETKHFLDQVFDDGAWCVTNPPYGVRLDQWTDDLVSDIAWAFSHYDLHGWFLLLQWLETPWFSAHKLMNGQQEVSFYKK